MVVRAEGARRRLALPSSTIVSTNAPVPELLPSVPREADQLRELRAVVLDALDALAVVVLLGRVVGRDVAVPFSILIGGILVGVRRELAARRRRAARAVAAVARRGRGAGAVAPAVRAVPRRVPAPAVVPPAARAVLRRVPAPAAAAAAEAQAAEALRRSSAVIAGTAGLGLAPLVGRDVCTHSLAALATH